MATSRYDTSANTSANTAVSTSANSSENATSTTNGTKTNVSNSTNMPAESLAALELLIQQLASGGTPAMQQQNADKRNQISTLTQQQQAYSKDAAFADAQGLMAQQMRLALEKVLPGINSGAIGAGSSQSSARALLTQKAAENAAQNAQAAGLGAAVQYGGVANGISSVLQQLIAQADPATAALLSALSVAKGTVTSSSSTETGSSTTNSSGSSNKNQVVAPSSSSASTSSPSTSGGSFGSYGPLATDQSIVIDNAKYAGTTVDTLRQLWGNDNFVNNYTF